MESGKIRQAGDARRGVPRERGERLAGRCAITKSGLLHGRPAIAITALLLLCVFILGGCSLAHSGSDSKDKTVICIDEEGSPYAEVLKYLLPDHTVTSADKFPFPHVREGAAVEAYDAQAYFALKAGIAGYWYPHYLATVVIAVDRDKTNSIVSGWSDLRSVSEDICIMDHPRINPEMLVAAISYGLEGKAYTQSKALELLADLQSEGRLKRGTLEPPIIICYDYWAAELIKNGRNIEIVVPNEGTLTYARGILSNTMPSFAGDVEDALLSAGFRLLDGRCDSSLYPDAAAYMSADMVEDYDHFSVLVQNSYKEYRRDVLRIRLYSSADGREHQLFALLYMMLVIVWLATVVRRTMQARVQRLVLVVGLMPLGWIVTRLIKYQTPLNSLFERYLWFCYYLFLLALPVALVWLAWVIDRPDNEPGAIRKAPKWMLCLTAINVLLVALVFTNDLHSLVFRVDYSDPNWPMNYGYGVGFYLVQICCWAPVVFAIFKMLQKSRKSFRKKGVFYLFVIMLLLVLYALAYLFRLTAARESDYMMVIGLFVLLLMEVAIHFGIIPVNSKYRTLFTHSHLCMRIIDAEKHTALSSASAVWYDYDTFANALESYPAPAAQDSDTLLFAAPIAGGYALWQEDISGLNRLHAEIEESIAKQKTANALLAEEEAVRRAAQEEIEKTLLMEKLEAEIAGSIIRMSTMIEQLEGEADKAKATARISLLLCYIKRRCNLFFHERERDMLPADELTVYFDEIAEIAGFSDVKVIVTSMLNAGLPVRQATLLYDFFYSVIDWASRHSGLYMLAYLGIEDGRVMLRLLPSEDATSFQLENSLEKAIGAAGGAFATKDLDDAVGLSLSFPEDGEETVKGMVI